MKLGVTGLLPRFVADVDAAAIRRTRELGFTGTGFSVSDLPADITTSRAKEVAQMCADEGVELVEYGRYQTTLIDLDPKLRERNIADLREAFRVAGEVGCPAVITGAGSLNPAGPWLPHPENHSPAILDRLVDAVREAARGAEEAGIVLGLECHVTTALKDAATARQVIDAVGSPALKVHLDPVNWMTFDTVYNNGQAIADMFATLGPERIYGAHSKGVVVEDRLIIHLSETHTGADDDLIDHASVLRELAKLPGDPYLVIEHLSVDQMPGARRHLLDVATRAGLSFSGQRTEVR